VNVALWLLAVQGVIGAFDTLYYHEWRARLPARGMLSAPELKLHAPDRFRRGGFGSQDARRRLRRRAHHPRHHGHPVWRHDREPDSSPRRMVRLCLTNDFIWWIPFALYLRDAWPAFTGDGGAGGSGQGGGESYRWQLKWELAVGSWEVGV